MKTKKIIIILLVSLILMTILTFVYIKNKEKEAVEIEKQHNEIWTCSMHPEINEKEKGQCPKCGMDLIKLEE